MPTSYLDISGDNDDYAPSIYTFFDKERYFFDSPEGCQRVIKERTSIKLSKIGGIFITNLSWDTIGGLFGILYILAGIDTVKDVNVYGPRGLYNIFYHARQFFNVSMKTNIFEMNDRNCEELPECTSSMNVTSIPIWSKKDQVNDGGPTIQEAFEKRVYHNFINPEEWLKMMNEGAPLDVLYKHVVKPSTVETDRSSVICYLGKTKPSPGRFYPEKAVALGIPRGAMFQKLIAGESIVSPKTNELVHPHQVSDPTVPGSKFLIVKCPSIEYFVSLFNQSVIVEYQNNQTEPINIVVHLTPASVIQHEEYQAFMNKFGNTTKHIIANRDNCPMAQSYYIPEKDITKFSHFFPTMFPGQWVTNEPTLLPVSVQNDNVVVCKKVTRGTIMPAQSVGKVEVVEMHEGLAEDAESKFYDFLYAHPKAIELRTKTLALCQQLEETRDEQSNVYPRVLFTGTGAAKPTKNRGVTGHLIETKKDCFMIMDGGEGTLAQITRFYGREQVKDILFNLRLIWVSHMHADHHLGIPSILEKREKLAKECKVDNLPKVLVVGPKDFQLWITSLNTIIPIDHLSFAYDESNDIISQYYQYLGIKSLSNVQVDHCPDAKGVVIELVNGFKLSFSGDTRPCEQFINAGRDSDLMIHEATFEDDKVEDSIEKKHSTIGEALTVGKRMNAKWSILTHFSGKTKTSVSIDTSAVGENFGMAFDFLNISPYQYPLLKYLNELQELQQELQNK
ncbi:hypothetical protein DFA_06207 [Cavenderia fasciculata]|uniref:ribonuclease Z n=1 Tax=Cavenderia fasciculata TaxID=261658 RepID=F4PKE5_CACFS|nr:uncharacterized protein DFA_06207 [Cavenderia fasciculata]EGG24069.1 hypothetical protein DFA_06207 [Cavenderia fasciculata]|eukprot:XP_004361920.1 hypothetical protein DFA_06207 [Cavenderia fasciculata]